MLVQPKYVTQKEELFKPLNDIKDWHFGLMSCGKSTNNCNFYAGIQFSIIPFSLLFAISTEIKLLCQYKRPDHFVVAPFKESLNLQELEALKCIGFRNTNGSK